MTNGKHFLLYVTKVILGVSMRNIYTDWNDKSLLFTMRNRYLSYIWLINSFKESVTILLVVNMLKSVFKQPLSFGIYRVLPITH